MDFGQERYSGKINENDKKSQEMDISTFKKILQTLNAILLKSLLNNSQNELKINRNSKNLIKKSKNSKKKP